MTERLDNIFAIEVPENAGLFEASMQPDNIPCVTYWYGENLDATVLSLPPGSYEIMFTTKGVTERQAGMIVERVHAGGFGRSGEEWKIYDDGIVAPRYATESLQSLLTSKGLTAGNYLIIKKVG